MRISLITVCYNSAAVIRTALDSVFAQTSSPEGSAVPRQLEIEYLVIDGGSTDGTVEILKDFEVKVKGVGVERRSAGSGRPSEGGANSGEAAFAEAPEEALPSRSFSFRWLSEKDNGMYDALNKGIKLSTGDIIGWLNADDALASDDILAKVAAAFGETQSNGVAELDGVYADIRFVRDTSEGQVATEGGGARSEGAESPSEGDAVFRGGSRGGAFRPEATLSALQALRSLPTSRYCSGKRFRPWMFRFGTQTAHPSTFFRRSCFDRWGFYSLDFGMFGDFELLCRFIWRHRARMRYLPLCTTVMRSGGASTNGWRTTLKINRTDLRALKANGCWSCYAFLYARYFFKIWGFLFK